MKARIVVLPGDGIGPEVTAEAVRALGAISESAGHRFEFEFHRFGGSAIDAEGVPLTQETLDACRRSDAILLGAVGGPRWEARPQRERPEAGLLRLRRELDLFANLRPVRAHRLPCRTALREEVRRGADLLLVRELSSGIYYGEPRGRGVVKGGVRAFDTMAYFESEIERVMEVACRLAQGRRKRLTVVDKANVLETSRLWREVAQAVVARHPGVLLDFELVDSFAARMILEPTRYDVVVAENLFGDILSDEAAVIAGSIGLLPSASLGTSRPGVFEPVHGSAPDIAGKGRANPLGAVGSAALLLRHGLGLDREATQVEAAIALVLRTGPTTPDVGGRAGTVDVGSAVVAEILRPAARPRADPTAGLNKLGEPALISKPE